MIGFIHFFFCFNLFCFNKEKNKQKQSLPVLDRERDPIHAGRLLVEPRRGLVGGQRPPGSTDGTADFSFRVDTFLIVTCFRFCFGFWFRE